MRRVNTDALAALIAGGETLAVEFTSERRGSLPDRDLVETVACMANRDDDGPDGWVLLGVEDDGVVTGARPRHQTAGTDVLRVQALVSNRTRPALAVNAEMFVLEGKDVLAIRVPKGRSPVGTADGRYLRRALGGDGKPACVPFHFHEMNARQADFGAVTRHQRFYEYETKANTPMAVNETVAFQYTTLGSQVANSGSATSTAIRPICSSTKGMTPR